MESVTPKKVRVKRERPKSRSQRWAEAAEKLREEFDQLEEQKTRVADAIEEMKEMQSEYQEWRDNLPENLEGSATAEKLDAITEIDMDVEADTQAIEELVNAVEGVDLPLGFGRD